MMRKKGRKDWRKFSDCFYFNFEQKQRFLFKIEYFFDKNEKKCIFVVKYKIMEQIIININSQYKVAFLNFLKTLNYIEVKEVAKSNEVIFSEIEKNDMLSSLTGAWQDDRSAEKIIEDIRQAHHFSRKVEDL